MCPLDSQNNHNLMKTNMLHRWLLIVPVALVCGFLDGCKEAKQVADLAQTIADPRAKGPMHERLKWKAEDFYTDKGVIKLCKAIEAKDLNEIERLVKSGVDVNAKGRGNMTPLLWAFPMGEDVFRKMLELGADPNVQLTERLMLAAIEKDHSVMSACVALTDGLIYSQLFYDVRMDNYLAIVLKHGGDPNLEDMDGNTVFVYAMICQHRAEKVKSLVDAGGDVNHRNHRGGTPILQMGSFYDYLLALLEAGADYRIAEEHGFDLILKLASLKMPQGPGGQVQSHLDREVAQAQPVFDWLTKEGVNWDAARAALKDKDLMMNLKNLPTDYQHRPWLPQRPTLKRSDAEPKKP
jgi:ankyrin repeat protein